MKRLFSGCILTLVIAITALASTCLGAGIGQPRDIEFAEQMEQLDNESHLYPGVVVYGTLYVNEDEIAIGKLLENCNDSYSFQEVLYVNEDDVYVLYIVDSVGKPTPWRIAQINLSSREVNDLCEFLEPTEYYSMSYGIEFRQRNAYFYQDKIVMSDKQSVVEYDILTSQTRIYSYCEYSFPRCSMWGECLDSDTVLLHIGEQERVCTTSDMKKDSHSLASIADFDVFSRSVQSIDEQIFVIAQCQNSFGESYAVVIYYDASTQKWEFVDSYFAYDIASRACYVVPANLRMVETSP